MKKEIIAPCGLSCTECLAYQATIADDMEMKRNVAEKWNTMFEMKFAPDDIHCIGCLKEGEHVAFCGQCTLRDCAIRHEVTSCINCAEYICDLLTEYRKNMPISAVKNHERLISERESFVKG